MTRKIFFLVAALLFACVTVSAQYGNMTMRISDSMVARYGTLQDDVKYRCAPFEIWKLDKGSLIGMLVYKEGVPSTLVYVVSPSKKNFCKGKALKINSEDSMSFRAYNAFSLESRPVQR